MNNLLIKHNMFVNIKTWQRRMIYHIKNYSMFETALKKQQKEWLLLIYESVDL